MVIRHDAQAKPLKVLNIVNTARVAEINGSKICKNVGVV
jgi:hypothetical protein